MSYNYRETVTDDIVEYIKNNIDLTEYAGRRDKLKNNLENNVTYEVSGQAAGSYTCDSPTARKNLKDNEDLIISAYMQLDMEDELPHVNGRLVADEDLVKYIDNPERVDMCIRIAIANSCIEDALRKIEDEMDIDLDDDRTFAETFVLIIKDELPDSVLSDIQEEICEDATFENNRLTLPDITPQEFGEITSDLEYENIDFEDERDVLKSDEKVFVVYEMLGNFSHEAFRTDNFNEAQDYLTNRENEARIESEKNGEEFDSQNFYSYFSLEETTVGELAKQDKERIDSSASTQRKIKKTI